MFERLKKALSPSDASPVHRLAPDAVSEWAGIKGFGFTGMGEGNGNGNGFALQGKIGNKP